MNSYTASFAVGDIPRVDIETECSNIIFNTGTLTGVNPSINKLGARQAGNTFWLTGTQPKACRRLNTGNEFCSVKTDDITITFSNPTFEMGGTNFSICMFKVQLLKFL